MSSSALELIDEISSYAYNPLGLVKAIFPWNEGELAGITGPYEWQAEELKQLGEHIKNPATRYKPYYSAVVSGNGPGKSALVGMVTKWALSCWPGARATVTANTGSQLNSKTQPEVAKWFRLAYDKDFWEVQATRISVKDEDYRANYRCDFETWTENNPEAIGGLHNKGKLILVIFDEASAIPRVIWDYVQGAFTDETAIRIWLAFGNGTLNEGPFFECFHKKSHVWHTRHIDTRYTPGTDKEEIKRWIEEDGLDSDWVRVHVLGQFPRHSELQFIGFDTADRARRYQARGYELLPKILACDVARLGSAETVIGFRQGRRYFELERYRRMDTQFTSNRVIHWTNEIKPQAVVVDAVGVGGGVVDYCKALGYEIFQFDGGAQAFDSMKYGNRRAETWAKGKYWLEAGAQIPDEEGLAGQICAPHFYYKQGQASHGALMIERKEDMAKRGLESPDRADALMLTFAVDVAPEAEQNRRSSPPRSPRGGWLGV